MGKRNIPEHFIHYFTFVQADDLLKKNLNLTSAFVILFGFGLRPDVFQISLLLKALFVCDMLGRQCELETLVQEINFDKTK